MAQEGIFLGFNLLIAMAATQSGPKIVPTPAPAITIVVRDYAGLPATVLEEAEAVAAAIYHQIGIDLRWLHSRDLPFSLGAGRPDSCRSSVVLDLIPLALERQTQPAFNALGSAVPSASFARVFVARVDALVASRRTHDRAQLLGHVVAHEVGHLLLGRNTHALAGLMAAELDVVQARQQSLTFSQEEVAAIHHHVRCGFSDVGAGVRRR